MLLPSQTLNSLVMKLIFQTLLFCFLAFTITSCDNDDDGVMDPMITECDKAVTFTIDGTEACATGTFTLGNGSSTTLNLVVDGGATIVIGVLGAGEQTFAIPAGNALYTSADGTLYASTAGGLLVVTDNDPTMSATFNFDAATTAGETVSISAGTVVGLGQ